MNLTYLMMKFYLKRSVSLFIALVSIAVLYSCSDDEGTPAPADDPIASFQFAVSTDNIFEVTFTNFSQNAVSYSWNFGDGNTSTDENPVHTYTATGTFNVALTATNSDGKTNTQTKAVTISDPDEELKKLTGDVSKTWKMLRDVSTGVYPLQVGPADYSDIWWSLGGATQLGERPCVLNDEYIFSLDGTFEYKTNGDTWADDGVWSNPPGPSCVDVGNPDNMKNVDGVDISAWGDGVHTFNFNPTAGTLTVTGTGAFIGLQKAATDSEVIVPQASVTYSVVRLVDGDVDTLIVETTIPTPGYWRTTLVHYDNPGDEPPIPGPPPTAGFTVDVSGFDATFTNTSTGATSYSWDFGDGNTSTEENPVHTYAACGAFTPILTAINANGQATAQESINVGADPTPVTDADLNGGSSKTWKLAPIAGAFRVGPSAGSGDWFASTADDVTNRACQFDDEFILKSDGSFEFAAMGQLYGEPFMGVDPNACVDEANLTPPYDGFASNAGYSYSLTPGDPAMLTVNGSGAFLGFNKPYNGGEYNGADGALQTSITYQVLSFVDCGTEQTLEIAVDIAGDGTAWWSMTLQATQ